MMGSSTQDTKGKGHDRSDLSQIRGIGAIRKRWLHSLGIDTIAALAQASATMIEAQAKRDGRTLSRDELEDWIAQAQVRYAEASLEQTQSSPESERSAPTDNAKPIVGEQEGVIREPFPTWTSIASFKVDYQTRQVNGTTEQRVVMQHLETDAVESWNAFEMERTQQWMRDRVEAHLAPLRTETPIVPEITHLRVMQPHYMGQMMTADRDSPIFSGAIQPARPFALEVFMRFAERSEATQQTQVAYRVQCFARNLATGITDCLSDITAHLSPSANAIDNVLLPSLQLQQPGTYRLKVLVMLQHMPAVSGQFKVPMLQVG